MAAKLLQKQIGCMNGIFRIFDRLHVLTGRRKSLTLGKLIKKSLSGLSCSKQSTSSDIKESFRVLTKFRETPQQVNMKDAPRLSVDSHNTVKSKQKLKELPRLSLDSRERVMRSPSLDLKSGRLSESLSGSSSSLQQLSKGSSKRPPSVVAKLMGLETLPGSPLGRDIHQFSLRMRESLAPHTAQAALQRMLPHPCKKQYTAVILMPQRPHFRILSSILGSRPESRHIQDTKILADIAGLAVLGFIIWRC